jgi:two-component system NtrC family response regulator
VKLTSYRRSFTDDAMQLLKSHPFHGNIRELKNLVERTILMSGKEEIGAGDFNMPVAVKKAQTLGQLLQIGTLDEIERRSILETMNTCYGNLSKDSAGAGLEPGRTLPEIGQIRYRIRTISNFKAWL